MLDSPDPLFSFDEQDHLTRIHLKLKLEDLGFVVVEDGTDIALVGAKPTDPAEPKKQG